MATQAVASGTGLNQQSTATRTLYSTTLIDELHQWLPAILAASRSDPLLRTSLAGAAGQAGGRFASAASFGLIPGSIGNLFGRAGQFAANDPVSQLRGGIRLSARDAGLSTASTESVLARGGRDSKLLGGFADILEAVNKEKRVRNEIERLTKGIRDAIELEKKTFKASEEARRKEFEANRRAAEAAERRAKLEERIEGILERAASRRRELEEQSARALERQIQGIKSNFARGLGGFSGDPALPRNIRQGLSRAQSFQNLEVKDRLRREYGRFSAGEIARDPDLRARILATTADARFRAETPDRRAREDVVARLGERIAPLGAAIDEASAASFAQLEESLAAITESAEERISEAIEASDKVEETFKKQAEVNAQEAEMHRQTAQNQEAHQKRLDAHQQDLAETKRILDRLHSFALKGGG